MQTEHDQRDERCRKQLLATIGTLTDTARRAEEEAVEARKEIARIQSAVRQEKWYELEGHLSSTDVESLCNVSPVDLLEDDPEYRK